MVNHLNGEEQKEERNVLVESARIARGNVKDLNQLRASDFDALIIPGGFGAAKNLSDFGFKGQDYQVKEDVANVLKDFHKQGKVIGLTCIAPILAAQVLGESKLKMTMGKRAANFPYAGSIDVAAKYGNLMEEKDVREVSVDWHNHIVTTPCYMQGDATPYDIYAGVDHFVTKVTSLVMQNKAT